MNFRLTSRFVAVLAVALIFFSATLQPAALAAPAFQDDGVMAAGQEYTIQAGDSLYKISSEYLGSGALWPQIQEATNAMAVEDDSFATIDQPSLIRSGQKIWIPAASVGEMMDESSEDMDGEMDHGDDDADHDMSSDENMDSDSADSSAAAKSLTDAAAQLDIAISHANLLGDSLAADDLAMAQAHAEHVINILDGEDGRFFGDANRDGKTQNPGDGVGVRGYLEQAETVAGSEEDGTEESDTSVSTAAAVETALQIFAVDTADEAVAIADELSTTLEELASAIGDKESADEAMIDEKIDGMNNDEMGEGTEDGSAMLFDEADGLFAAAAAQVELAIGHSGFLADELDSDSLDAAKNHAEHVINILDGEDGLFYGDNNRDGQTQNPGDGTGVRSYLEQALAQVQAGDSATGEELVTALELSLALVEDGSVDALGIFATDTSGDALPIADSLATSLADMLTGIGELQDMAPSMDEEADSESMEDDDADESMGDMGMAEDVALAVASVVSDQEGEGVLLSAQTQAEMATKHYTFLEDSLANGDLAMALAHAEHVINILDGEDGLLFGDNNRDGQTQNPGDGKGVRAHLADAGEQIIAALEGADAGDAQALVDAIQQGEQATNDSAAGAVQLFAAADADDAQPIADELGQLLAGLQASIAAAISAASATP